MIDASYPGLSIVRQCELLSLNRSGYYWNLARKEQTTEDEYNLLLMRLMDIYRTFRALFFLIVELLFIFKRPYSKEYAHHVSCNLS